MTENWSNNYFRHNPFTTMGQIFEFLTKHFFPQQSFRFNFDRFWHIRWYLVIKYGLKKKNENFIFGQNICKSFERFWPFFIKFVKIYQNSIENIERKMFWRKKFLVKNFNIWPIVVYGLCLKLFIWSIFSHFVTKLFWFLDVDKCLINGKFNL